MDQRWLGRRRLRLVACAVMQKYTHIKLEAFLRRSLLFCLLINGLLAAVAHAQTADPVMVAIAYQATNEETIPRASLRAIFGMRLQNWPADTLIRVFVLRDDAPEHATFSKTVLQVFPQQLRMAWDRQVFSGQGRYPEQVAST